MANNGDAVARNGTLTFQFDAASVNVISEGELRRQGGQDEGAEREARAEEQEARTDETGAAAQRREGAPTEAARAEETDAGNARANEREARTADDADDVSAVAAKREAGAMSWQIGDLAPGESARVRVTMVGKEQAVMQTRAHAEFDCAAAPDADRTAVATGELEIIALPALRIAVVDQQDPVAVGDEVTYEVHVANEGTATDRNVRVSVSMPEQLTFVEGSGETEVHAEGGRIEMAPIDQLAPGEAARWEITTRADAGGDVRFRVRVNSDYLTTAAMAEEPTHTFSAETGESGQREPSLRQRQSDEREGAESGAQEGAQFSEDGSFEQVRTRPAEDQDFRGEDRFGSERNVRESDVRIEEERQFRSGQNRFRDDRDFRGGQDRIGSDRDFRNTRDRGEATREFRNLGEGSSQGRYAPAEPDRFGSERDFRNEPFRDSREFRNERDRAGVDRDFRDRNRFDDREFRDRENDDTLRAFESLGERTGERDFRGNRRVIEESDEQGYRESRSSSFLDPVPEPPKE